jgi:chaperone BCS1
MMQSILDFFMQYYDIIVDYSKQFIDLTKDNPVLGGVIGLYGAGVLGYFTRDLPGRFINWVKVVSHKQFTISMTISNYDREVYDSFLSWYEKENFSKKSRTLRAEDCYKGKSRFKIGAGLGNHYFVRNWRLFKLSRSEKDLQNSTAVKETIRITTLGRSRKPFENLLRLSNPDREDSKGKLHIYKWSGSEWKHSYKQTQRDLDTVILKEGVKEKIIQHFDKFEKDRTWYLDNGVPYRTGVLLEGPGGTGKTSIVRAICSTLNKNLYIMNLGLMSDSSFEAAMTGVDIDAIVLIEDVDAFNITLNRESGGEDGSKTSTDFMKFNALTMSGILNGIDGVAGSEGRILIATTNHPEKLDKALIRPGRFDLVEHIGYLDNESFIRMFNRFFPENMISEIDIKKELTPATVQALVIANLKTPEVVLRVVSSGNFENVKTVKESFFFSGESTSPEEIKITEMVEE